MAVVLKMDRTGKCRHSRVVACRSSEAAVSEVSSSFSPLYSWPPQPKRFGVSRILNHVRQTELNTEQKRAACRAGHRGGRIADGAGVPVAGW
jgi:hypothetical protein